MTVSSGSSQLPTEATPGPCLRDQASFDRLHRYLITHPFFIGLLLAAPMLKVLGYMPRAKKSLWLDLMLHGLRVAPFAVLYYLFNGRITRALMLRGVPYAVADFVLWVGWSSGVALVVGLLLGAGSGMAMPVLALLIMQIFVFLLHLLKLMQFESRIKAGIFVRPQQGSLWRACRVDPGPAPHIAPGLEGELLSLQAQNQYVLVTTSVGQQLVRMSMHAAVEGMAPGAGLSIHRSWWVGRALLAGASFDERRSVLVAADGTEYQVSKSRRDDLRDCLALLQCTGRAEAPADRQRMAG